MSSTASFLQKPDRFHEEYLGDQAFDSLSLSAEQTSCSDLLQAVLLEDCKASVLHSGYR